MFKKFAKSFLKNKTGYRIYSKLYFLARDMGLQYPDLSDEFMELKSKCSNFTMTSLENLYYVHNSVKHIVKYNIPGSFVECGVWKGGNVMMMALTLLKLGINDRKIYLYDTFEGMSEPTDKDYTFDHQDAKDEWKDSQKDDHNEWCYSSLDEVKDNVYSTGYPKENFIFVKGKVEDTLPGTMPEQIALLRLDTDWFESTYQELIHLYPLLTKNGFLVIDDYGHWEGARQAVDKYFQEKKIDLYLNRIDYTARGGIKTS